MATIIRKNERSWAIELISQINQISAKNDLVIKRAGGESTVSEYRGQNMFPDVILYGDNDLSSILQGWELKMPDVPITDTTFVEDAQRKARALNLNSCVIWNFTHIKLFVYNTENKEFEVKQEWSNHRIKTRKDVQLYKSNWEYTLKDVLTSINEYLVSGDIKKTFIGDALTKTSIANLVNEYKSNVANCLKEGATRDAIMGARIDTWWKEIKTEYEGDEEDKFSAYAKSIIINWANRIIFAHLIKRHQKNAFIIDKLNYDYTPKDANELFQEITQNSDFLNIFGKIRYNEFISKEAWASLIELSLFLKDSPIKDISQQILQQILEDSVNESKRLVNGQYPTPPILGAILSRMTIHNWLGECYDGCCGTGTLPNFIINYKKNKIGASKAMETTWASDKFKLPLQIANLAMTSYDTINMPCRIFQQDILKLCPGDEVEIVNPQTGKKDSYTVPLFDAIVSNLPFVKASEIPTEDSRIVNEIKQANHLSGRADYSYYIALYLKNLVKEGGYVGIILSNSFLGTEAGSQFITALREYFDDIKIHISGNGKWFSNAEIVTALLIMRKKSEDTEENSSISFFTWKQSLNAVINNREYKDIIINSSLLDSEIDSSVIRRVNYDSKDLESLHRMNVSYNSLFSNLKWLLEIKDKLVPISNYFSVFRGSRRGWDRLFYPDSISTHIEPIFLRDVLMNARATDNYIAAPSSNKKAFCCDLGIEELEAMGYQGALAWIRKFANATNGTNRPLPEVLAMNGLKWYELSTDEVAELFTMMNPDNRMFYAKFNKPTFINQRLIGLKRKHTTDNLDLLHALLNSVLSLFYIEAVGFGRGLGVLDISKDSISKCFMLNPALLINEQKKEILKKFEPLVKRGIKDINQDLEDPIRQEFDNVVLNAYEISEYHDIIINTLISMRKIRKTVISNTARITSLNNTEEYVNNDSVFSVAADKFLNN